VISNADINYILALVRLTATRQRPTNYSFSPILSSSPKSSGNIRVSAVIFCPPQQRQHLYDIAQIEGTQLLSNAFTSQ